jgi:hypothetical protein
MEFKIGVVCQRGKMLISSRQKFTELKFGKGSVNKRGLVNKGPTGEHGKKAGCKQDNHYS